MISRNFRGNNESKFYFIAVNLPFDQEDISVEEELENNYDVEAENMNEKEIVVEQDTFSTTSSNGSVKDKIPIR